MFLDQNKYTLVNSCFSVAHDDIYVTDKFT